MAGRRSSVPADPRRRADAGERRRRGIAAVRPCAVDVASRRGGRARREGPGEARAFFAAARPADGAGMTAVEHRFGPYGGRYVPETLMPALDELERAWLAARDDPAFQRRARAGCCATTPGARRRSTTPRGCPRRPAAPVWLKREDLLHTGAHKLNNALGQALLAKRMGKPRDHRRDRRGPARRRDRDGVRAARPRVRRLHGHRGHAPPAAQRPADGAARRHGRARRGRGADAQGGRLARRSATGSPTSDDDALRDRLAPSARRRSPRSCATCSA